MGRRRWRWGGGGIYFFLVFDSFLFSRDLCFQSGFIDDGVVIGFGARVFWFRFCDGVEIEFGVSFGRHLLAEVRESLKLITRQHNNRARDGMI